MSRTIILLSDFKSGSTAIQKIFKQHNDVKFPHNTEFNSKKYGHGSRWEMRFWDLAADAIDGNVLPFLERMTISNPSARKMIRDSLPLTKEKVFSIWDAICRRKGQILLRSLPNT